ncbi:GroES-like protein [Meredithblackwellia eburnea MCA 4105]
MKAARFHGNQTVKLEEVDVPVLRPDEVKIKVAFAGICGSDCKEVHTRDGLTCSFNPHPITGESLPIILGHEFSGEIVEKGSQVSSRLTVGANVCVEPVISCLKCDFCVRGERPLCSQLGFFGYNRGGGFASYVNVTEYNCHVIPSNIPLKRAAFAEPLAVACRAVRKSGFKQGEKALVVGGGPLGLLIARLLKAKGAAWVGVSQSRGARAERALEGGADAIFHRAEVNVPREVHEATGGGVHVAFECAGNQESLDTSIESTQPQGRVVVVGLWTTQPKLNIQAVLFGERIVTGSCCAVADDFKEALEALSSGKVRVDDLITSTIRLEDIRSKGFDALDHDKAQIKIMVDLGT